jgi:glucosamine--fructose-6-phosphate aminotransferase (isomerizing)
MTKSTRPGEHTYREIKGQTEAWAATLADGAQISKTFSTAIKQTYHETLFTGCGSTYYLALTAARLWQSLCGVPARAMPASDLWLFANAWVSEVSCLLVALSRSGETTETVQAVKTYRAMTQGQSLAITCNPASALALETTATLVTKDAFETSVAQTRSFTSMLVLLQYVAGLKSNLTEYIEELRCLPAHGLRLIAQYEPLMQSLASETSLDHIVFLGSGPLYGLACEAMLKMKEMSLTWCESFHFLEYRHGPKSTVGTNTLVVSLLSDSAYESEIAVLSELQELGASVLAMSDSERGFAADHRVVLQSGLGELARGVLYLPLLQLLAYYRGLSKDLDPDLPTHLNAVVRL